MACDTVEVDESLTHSAPLTINSNRFSYLKNGGQCFLLSCLLELLWGCSERHGSESAAKASHVVRTEPTALARQESLAPLSVQSALGEEVVCKWPVMIN